VLAGLHEHSSIFLKQPVQTTKLLQPMGVHASNVLASLPQLHFCMQELRWLSIYLACVSASRNSQAFLLFMLITILLPAQHGQRRGNFIAGAIIAGDAIAGSLFLLWLDMMFAISSFNAQNTSGAPTTVSDFTLGVLQAIPSTGWAHPTGHKLLCYHAARPVRGCHVRKNILTGNSGVTCIE
jgi:hypothetical protein